MAISESIRNSDNRNLLSRRDALQGTAAATALVLPAGVAVAATGAIELPDVDPGLAQLEEGYRRWQELRARIDPLYAAEEAATERAEASLPPRPPRPTPPEPIVWLWTKAPGEILDAARDPSTPVSISPELLEMVDQHEAALDRWYEEHPPQWRDPHFDEIRAIEAKRDRLLHKAGKLRRQLLAIPTTSPRGLLIKLALTVEAERLEDIEAQAKHVGAMAEDVLPHLLVDLKGMVGRAVT